MSSSSISLQIPAGKLGTVRIDRTVDVYSSAVISDPNVWNVQSCQAKVLLPNPLTSVRKENCDDDLDDIAVIYSLVRRASTRRASSPRIPVLPLNVDNDPTAAQTVKSYTLGIPSASANTHLTATPRIPISSSFNSHDRPSVPLIQVKPRPYSFRTQRRSVIERQISQITERVSQLHESFLSRWSNGPRRPRNRSLSTFNESVIPIVSRDYSIKRRPKSEIFDDHYRVNQGRAMRRDIINEFVGCLTLKSDIPMSFVFSSRKLSQLDRH